MARKLRQVVDLYTTGDVLVLRDGQPVWVQPMNPFEADTARNEAQIAKTRLTLAIREHGSEERDKVQMYFFTDGIDGARERLVEAKITERSSKIFESIRNDPEWTDRMLVLDRGMDDTAPLEEAEEALLLQITNEYAIELGKRIDAERDFQKDHYAGLDEDALWEDYLKWYIDRRAGEKMMAEFRLHQVYFGVRWCDGEKGDDGTWDHAACNGHQDRMFATTDEVRTAPEELMDLLFLKCDEVDMTAREAKNSARQGSSSDSSPLPSAAGESTASTPDETPVAPPGSLSSPSPTPSPSLAGVS